MNEDFIAFIWKFQLYNHKDLKVYSGEPLSVISNGYQNFDSGPDFLEGKIKVNNLKWSGAVELHVKASYWESHRHHEDDNYNNVILHVVWENDRAIKRKDGTLIPTLELKDKVDSSLYENFLELNESIYDIPCQHHISKVSPLQKSDMISRVLIERLTRKTRNILLELESNKGDWEQQCFQSLCTYFGFRLNNESFSRLARSIPYSIIRKYIGSLNSIESILFGQSGWLELQFEEEYHTGLKAKYNVFKKKFDLERILEWTTWKFNQTRPANFPTLRIAQLAALLNSKSRLFDYFMYSDHKELNSWFKVEVSDFWRNHYHFGKKLESGINGCVGPASVDILLTNVIVPLRFAYGFYLDNTTFKDSALELIQRIKPERNRIISKWNRIDIIAEDASMSQSLIELYQSYCCKKRCLSCKIGNSLVRNNGIND